MFVYSHYECFKYKRKDIKELGNGQKQKIINSSLAFYFGFPAGFCAMHFFIADERRGERQSPGCRYCRKKGS